MRVFCENEAALKLTTTYDLQLQKTSVQLGQGLQKSTAKKAKSIHPIVKDIIINFEDATAVESNLQRLKCISDRVDKVNPNLPPVKHSQISKKQRSPQACDFSIEPN